MSAIFPGVFGISKEFVLRIVQHDRALLRDLESFTRPEIVNRRSRA